MQTTQTAGQPGETATQPTQPTQPAGAPLVDEASRWPLALLGSVFLGTFMALLDVSIVSVALPTMQRRLGVTVSSLQWVVDGYTLCLSALVLSAGALSDRFGRKRIFLLGIAGFSLGSGICALAPDFRVLLVGRVVQGIAAAGLIPGALAILGHRFPDHRQRAKVIGMWGGCAGLALVAGPLVGGVIVDRVGWPWIFVINVPLGVLALALGSRHIGESADPAHAAFDPWGQVLSICWLALLTYGFIEAGADGWGSLHALVTLALAAVGLAAFLVVELRRDAPMLPVRLFGGREFALLNLASFVMGFSAFAPFFVFSLFLQGIQADSALVTGLHYLPLCLGEVVLAAIAGRLSARFGPRPPIVLGYVLMGVALVVMTTFSASTGSLVLAVDFAALGIGMGLAIAPVTSAAMGVVARERSGVASATINAIRQTGTSLGIALLGSVLATAAASRFASGLESSGTSPALAQRVALAAVARHVPPVGSGLSPARFAALYDSAFAGGFHVAMVVAGCLSFVIALCSLALRPHVR